MRKRRFREEQIIGILQEVDAGATVREVPRAGRIVVEGSLLKVSGDGQVGSLGKDLSDPLIVQVLDPSGDGLQGVTVAWSVNSNGMVNPPATVTTDDPEEDPEEMEVEEVSAGGAVTDSAGLAKVLWTLGLVTGAQSATEQAATAGSASVSGVGSVVFTATTPSLVPLTDMGASTYFGFPGGSVAIFV